MPNPASQLVCLLELSPGDTDPQTPLVRTAETEGDAPLVGGCGRPGLEILDRRTDQAYLNFRPLSV